MSAREVTLPDRFQGGRNLVMGGLVGGVVLLAVTFAGLLSDPRHTMFSYLVAFLSSSQPDEQTGIDQASAVCKAAVAAVAGQ